MALSWLKLGSGGPSWRQDGSTWPILGQVVPKLVQVGPNLVQVGSKSARTWLKLALSWPQLEPTSGQYCHLLFQDRPSWSKLASKATISSRLLDPPDLVKSWFSVQKTKVFAKISFRVQERQMGPNLAQVEAKLGSRWAQVGPSWLQVGLLSRCWPALGCFLASESISK